MEKSVNGDNDLKEEELLELALRISKEEQNGEDIGQSIDPPSSTGTFKDTDNDIESKSTKPPLKKAVSYGFTVIDTEEDDSYKAPPSPNATRKKREESDANIPKSVLFERAMKKLQEQPELIEEIRTAKAYRRHSLLPMHDLELYPAADPDCGKPGHAPHLSRSHAKETTEQFRLGHFEGGEKVPYKMSDSFGWFRWPFTRHEETENGVLAESCGIGVAFYFKLLKALIIIFAVMNVLTLPSMCMYILGNSIGVMQRKYLENTSSQNILASSTIAAIGEPTPICMRVEEGGTMALNCPGSSVIRSVVAYYGQPQGSCTCPGIMQSDRGSCNGTRAGSSKSASIISNSLDYKGQRCVPDSSGIVRPCFLGSTRFGIDCCSTTLDTANHADLTSLLLNPTPFCNSYTAPYALEALCTGSNSCQLPVAINGSIAIPLSSLPTSVNVSSLCSTVTSSSCITTLGRRGSFSGCAASPKYLFVEAFCVFTSHVLAHDQYVSSIANQKISIDRIVFASSVLDAISILVFFLGILWVRLEQDYEDREYNQLTCRASDYTVECRTIPEHTNAEDLKVKLKNHFETVLSAQQHFMRHEPIRIADINFASRNYRYIRAACDRGALSIEVDRLLGKFTSRLRQGTFNFFSWKNIYLLNSIKVLMYRFEIANNLCEHLQEAASKEIMKAFITFETEEGWLRCVQTYPNVGFLTSYFQPEHVRLENKVVRVRKPRDPSDIKWENTGIPAFVRFFRLLVTTLLTVALLVVSYVMIFEARYLAQYYSPKELSIPCQLYSGNVDYNPARLSASYIPYKPVNASSNVIYYKDVLYDQNWQAYQQPNYGSNGYVLCYCQQINFDRGLSTMNDYQFFNIINGKSETWCKDLNSSSLEVTAIDYIATFIIIAINLALSMLLKLLVDFEKWNCFTNETISLSVKLFVAQFINTGMLSLIIYGDLSRAGASNVNFGAGSYVRFGLFTGDSKDFDSVWYLSVGSSMIFTMCIYVFSGIFANGCYIFLNYLKRKWDKRTGKCTPMSHDSITHCDVQTELDMLYIGEQFPIQYLFAASLTMVFVNMTYSACMPLLNIVVLVSLGIQYIMEKWYLIRFHATPPAYSADLAKVMTQILYFAALMHCAVGMWMFGNSNFYAPDFQDRVNTFFLNGVAFMTKTHSWDEPIIWFSRSFGEKSILLFAVGALIAAYLFLNGFWYMLYNVSGIRVAVQTLLHHCGFQTELFNLVPEGNPTYFDSLPEELLQWRIDSQIITGPLRDKYVQQLAELKSGQATQPDRQMSGLETYNIGYSPEYSVKFGLDSNFLWRYAPDDWLIPHNAEVMHSQAPHLRKSMASVLSKKATLKRIFEDGKYEKEIEQVLRYCAPLIAKNAKGDVDVIMRKRNIFYSSTFDNETQQGEKSKFKGASISGGHLRGSVTWDEETFMKMVATSSAKMTRDTPAIDV